MARRALVVAIVVCMAVGVWLLWPRDQPTTSTTQPVAEPSSTTTTDTVAPTSTSTSTTVDSHVVETVEEAEEILRELWFGWFEGIYNQDEDRIREVVATEALVSAAERQFGLMEFLGEPLNEAVRLTATELLESSSHCLVVWSTVHTDFRQGSTETVQVLRRTVNGTWAFFAFWTHKEDLWQHDCDASLSSS